MKLYMHIGTALNANYLLLIIKKELIKVTLNN